jgi:general secretion pathway protein A
MSYYRILGFDKEPFSTSPDPDFFYLTRHHDAALTNILIELRLRRGLSVVLGDVGTGKTTLSRKLVQCLKDRDDFQFHIVLDPCFDSEYMFLNSLIRNFNIPMEGGWSSLNGGQGPTVLDFKEALEKFLYQTCIVDHKTTVLIIDEAQKLSESSLEMLRVLLNYETNENKLLQLVLLGQLELHSKIFALSNFMDRISFKYMLNPLSLEETRDLVRFRILQAGYSQKTRLFPDHAIQMIHEASKGYPRKITMLCHRALKHLVLTSKWVVDESVVQQIVEEDVYSGWLIKT